MAMLRYLKVDNFHTVDLETAQFYKIMDSSKLDVTVALPPYLVWEGFGKYPNDKKFKRVNPVQFRDFSVKTRGNYKTGVVKFHDKLRHKDVVAEIHVKARRNNAHGTTKESLLLEYDVSINGETMSFHNRAVPDESYRRLNGPVMLYYLNDVGDNFCYGLSIKQYTVAYRDTQLGGSCYAYVNGPWGILLDDDLTFDSLVTFTEYRDSYLKIGRILYTVNTYLMKTAVLRGS